MSLPPSAIEHAPLPALHMWSVRPFSACEVHHITSRFVALFEIVAHNRTLTHDLRRVKERVSLEGCSIGGSRMRSYCRRQAVGFRDGVSGGDAPGLGVLDPRAASGPALAVAPAPKNPRQGAPHLLDLPRPVFLDSSLTDGRGGRYSFFTADPFLVIRSRGRRV